MKQNRQLKVYGFFQQRFIENKKLDFCCCYFILTAFWSKKESIFFVLTAKNTGPDKRPYTTIKQ